MIEQTQSSTTKPEYNYIATLNDLARLEASLEISTEPNGRILVAPVQQACATCGKSKELTEMRPDKYLCRRCTAEAVLVGGV